MSNSSVYRNRLVFDGDLELLAGVKSDDPPGCDRDRFASFGVAPGARWLVAYLEIAKTGKLDRFTTRQRIADFLKKRIQSFELHIVTFWQYLLVRQKISNCNLKLSSEMLDFFQDP